MKGIPSALSRAPRNRCNRCVMIEFTETPVGRHGGSWDEGNYVRRGTLTLTDQAVDRESNRGRICFQTSRPSRSGGTRGIFGYKKQD